MANTEEVPSQASRAEAVAEAGMGANNSPPIASGQGTDVEKGEKDGSTSPSSSTNRTEEKDGMPVAAPEEPQMGKGKTTLIMSALCV